MKIARPSIAEERWLLVASRYPALRVAVERAGHDGGWKTSTWLARCLGFLLGLFATSLLAGALVALPSPLLVGGIALMIAAEWLVAKRRVFRSGIEEALYLCGAVAVVVQLLVWSKGGNLALGVAFIAAAVLLVGWRLLNPLFTTLAAAGASLAVALVGERLFGGRLHALEAAATCALLGVAALAAGGRTLRRPAHDRMLEGLAILMPWLAWGWLTAWSSGTRHYAALVLALVFFAASLAIGVKRRQHAPLIGALGSLVCIGWSLHVLLRWPPHWELLVAGGALLVVAILLDRSLRQRETGITSRAIDEPAGLDLAQLAGAAHMAPAPGVAPAPGFQGQGGEFGGGGASGRF